MLKVFYFCSIFFEKENLARRPQKAHGRDMTRCASLSRRVQSIRFSDAMRLYPRTYAAREDKKKKSNKIKGEHVCKNVSRWMSVWMQECHKNQALVRRQSIVLMFFFFRDWGVHTDANAWICTGPKWICTGPKCVNVRNECTKYARNAVDVCI